MRNSFWISPKCWTYRPTTWRASFTASSHRICWSSHSPHRPRCPPWGCLPHSVCAMPSSLWRACWATWSPALSSPGTILCTLQPTSIYSTWPFRIWYCSARVGVKDKKRLKSLLHYSLFAGMPQDLYNLWQPDNYPFSDGICILESVLSETAANATVLTITSFTVERYIAICHPFRWVGVEQQSSWLMCLPLLPHTFYTRRQHTMSKLSRAIKFIFAIWIAALLLALPQAIQFSVVNQGAGSSCTVNMLLLARVHLHTYTPTHTHTRRVMQSTLTH